MLQGQLLTYDPATGNGIVSANGERFAFDIHRWKADSAPQVGLAVEVHSLSDGSKEFRPGEMTITSQRLSAVTKAQGSAFRSAFTTLGWRLILAHLGFVGAVFWVPVMHINIGILTMSQSVWGILDGNILGRTQLVLAIVAPLVVIFGTNRWWRVALVIPAWVGLDVLYELSQVAKGVGELEAAAESADANPLQKLLALGAQGMSADWNGGATVAFCGLVVTGLAWVRYGQRGAR